MTNSVFSGQTQLQEAAIAASAPARFLLEKSSQRSEEEKELDELETIAAVAIQTAAKRRRFGTKTVLVEDSSY